MSRREAALALAATLAFCPPAPAEVSPPVLLRDIGANPTYVQPLYEWSGAILFVPFAGATFFDAWDGAYGHELRRSDGTPGGTAALRDLCPGACNGRESPELVVSAGALWFQGNDGAHGFELWRSDGTAAGTTLVKDVVPGLASSHPTELTPAPGGLYFVADDGAHGKELWWSDGTAAGTQLVADLLPGDPDPIPNVLDALGPTSLAVVGGVLLFAAEDGVNGRELWRSDGTGAGTTLVEDLVPGAAGGIWPQPPLPFWSGRPAVAGGCLFFAVRAGASDTVPWVSDGTAAGTIPLVESPASGWQTDAFFPFDDDVLFSGGASDNRSLWRSDGTPAGTQPLGSAANGGERLDPSAFARLGELVYFDGFQTGAGRELWVTDGTAAGTQLVTEIVAGAAGAVANFGFAAGGGRVFFPASDGAGAGLWASDGTAAGTVMVSDLDPGFGTDIIGFGGASPTHPAAIGDRLYFRGWDGEQWSTRTLDFQSGAQQTLHDSSDPAGSMAFCCSAVPHQDGFGFVAFDSTHGGEPWVTDGTAGGTALVADVVPGYTTSMWFANEERMASLPGKLLFVAAASDEEPAALWSFDGAAVTQLASQGFFAGPDSIASWHGSVFFGMNGGFWQTDGTVAGTVQLQPSSGHAKSFTPAGDALFFVDSGGSWVTDGTAAGTHRVAPSVTLAAGPMAAAKDEGGGDRLYFAAKDSSTGRELWVSDGTDAGTRRVVDLRPGNGDAIPVVFGTWQEEGPILAALGTVALFVADAGTGSGQELWVSDGSPGDATLLEVRPGPQGSEPRWVTAVGDRAYFVADDGVHGRELWATDGTLAGTQLIDLRPGPDSSMPTSLESWNGQLFFAADDGVHGMELWQTLDAPPGAQLVVDLRPGIAPSSPQGLTKNGDALMFFADDGTTGIEPFAVFARRPLVVDGFESGGFASWSALTPAP